MQLEPLSKNCDKDDCAGQVTLVSQCDGLTRVMTEEILTGRIKATDAQIAALPAIPKEERPAILDELRKEKDKRNEALLSRLKPERPPPKPASPKLPEPP